VAAQLPFKEVIGVELSPLHCEVAETNIKRYLSDVRIPVLCRNVRVSCVNAADFQFPDANLLIICTDPSLGPYSRTSLIICVGSKQRRGAAS